MEDKEYTISGSFEFQVLAPNEEEAMEQVNDKLFIENINYNIWGGKYKNIFTKILRIK